MLSQIRVREEEVVAQMQIVRFVVEDFVPSTDPAKGRTRLAQRVTEKFGKEAASAFFSAAEPQLGGALV